jgi:hypothetical protein
MEGQIDLDMADMNMAEDFDNAPAIAAPVNAPIPSQVILAQFKNLGVIDISGTIKWVNQEYNSITVEIPDSVARHFQRLIDCEGITQPFFKSEKYQTYRMRVNLKGTMLTPAVAMSLLNIPVVLKVLPSVYTGYKNKSGAFLKYMSHSVISSNPLNSPN